MERRFNVIPLIHKTDKGWNFWVARIFYDTVATIQTGEIGEIGNVDKIKTSIFRKVDELIEERKSKKLVEGYKPIENNDLKKLNIVIARKEDHDLGEKWVNSEIEDELDEINDDVNDFLMKRGLSFRHHTYLMENGDVILKFFVLDKKLAEEMILKDFGPRIDKLKQKIENWS
mgnify:CR=1 FL=1